MADICLDTNVLADFLKQYFYSSVRTGFTVGESQHISRSLGYRINSILNSHYRYEIDGIPPFGLIVASAIAFIELSRKFDSIFAGQLTVDQFAAFVDSPPSFFTIEAMGFDVLRSLVELPSTCWLAGEQKGIEAVDNLHVATARVRDDCVVAATDQKLVAAYGGADVIV